MKPKYIYTFLVTFKNEIKFKEVPLLRGAIIDKLGPNAEVLFHNHIGESGFRYSYPLVQYKRIRKKAAIFCVGDGVDVIGCFLQGGVFHLLLGGKDVIFEVDSVSSKRCLFQTWDTLFKYNLNNWLPLNSDNYSKYKELENLSEKISFLENILIGNLLSLAKGLGVDINNKIECKLVFMDEPRLVTVKNVKMMSFNVQFKSNFSLPDYIGLGKHVSIGFGTVVKDYSGENNNTK